MSEQASQSQETQEIDVSVILEQQFGIKPKEVLQKQNAEKDDDQEDELDEDEKSNPAKEEPKNVRKVRFNKKDVEIADDQVDELLQKGLALDKERERKSELEKSLMRAAKLHGYDSVDDYLANLDNIEKQTIKQQKDQFDALIKKVRKEAEDNGLDPDAVEEYFQNLPELKEARKIIERDEQRQTKSKEAEAKELSVKGWEELFIKYPDLADETSEDGTEAPWLTQEMQKRIDRGYTPLDAFELVNRDKILADERKKHEQTLLKQQRLNKRAKIEGTTPADSDDDDPYLDKVKGAFAEFGLDPRKAKQFMKK